jgi:hypothetical protein
MKKAEVLKMIPLTFGIQKALTLWQRVDAKSSLEPVTPGRDPTFVQTDEYKLGGPCEKPSADRDDSG